MRYVVRAVPIRRRPGRPAARAARPPVRPAGGGRPGILTAGIRPRCPLSPASAPTDTRIRPLGRCQVAQPHVRAGRPRPGRPPPSPPSCAQSPGVPRARPGRLPRALLPPAGRGGRAGRFVPERRRNATADQAVRIPGGGRRRRPICRGRPAQGAPSDPCRRPAAAQPPPAAAGPALGFGSAVASGFWRRKAPMRKRGRLKPTDEAQTDSQNNFRARRAKGFSDTAQFEIPENSCFWPLSEVKGTMRPNG